MTDTAAPFGFTYGSSHVQTDWPDYRRAAWHEMVDMLTSHVPGPKEGSCIVPARFRGRRRHKDDAEQIDVVFLDSDSGASLSEIEAALRRHGWEAVVSSTHSHMATVTKVKLRNWDRFFERNPAATPADILVREKGYLPAVAEDASASETVGDYVFVTHRPCPKFRIAMPLQQPWLAAGYGSQDEANAAWKERIEALAGALGLSHDQACTDTSRLFYLPRHPGNGVVPETAVVAGKACDIFALPVAHAQAPGLFEALGAKRHTALQDREFIDPVSGEIIDLADWAKQFGGTFMIAKALKARRPGVLTGHVADSRVHIDCPNAGAHTDPGRDGASYCINGGASATKGFVVHCRHAHCADKDRLSFVHDMLCQGWLTTADLTEPDFLGAAEAPPDDRAQPSRPRRSETGDIVWPTPVNFMAEDNYGAPVLEERHVPAVLWPFVKDVAERMGVDPSGVALAALVCCASVVNEKWRLQPRRHDYTYTEGARLWGAILGPPSTIKTAQISVCSKPLDDMETKARKRHQEEMQTYEVALAAHKAALKAKEKSEEPKMPKLKRNMVEDATVEAISEVLRDSNDPKGKQYAPSGKVLVRQDELSEWFANQDRYKGGGGSDRGAYLRLFNGQRYSFDRVMRGPFSVSSWSACILGGCQPGPIQKIARDAADDGLLQRFLWCVPAGPRIGIDRPPDWGAIKRYHALFPALASLEPTRDPGQDFISPIVLHRDAHAIREEVEAVARAMMAMPDVSKRTQSAFGKWGAIFMRLVLTFHMIEIADARAQGNIGPPVPVVSAEVVQQASDFMLDIVLPHQMRAEAMMFATAQTGHAQWIAGFILVKTHKRITRTDITRAYGHLRAPEAAQELAAIMANLVNVGWLEPEETTNFAKGTHAWLVNPQVHTLFADRAAQERSTRAETQEQAAKDLATLMRKRRNKASGA